MRLALRLAAKGRGRTSPNPLVGAVVVSGGRMVGQGYHRRVGGPHAEIHALHDAGRRAAGATLYLTLEPCVHRKKRTPPCVPTVIQSAVRRVVIAMPDPNPLVNGKGIRALRRAGVRVEVGRLQAEAERLNEAYSHRVRTGRPFVTLKAAMTLDGKIAAAGGESQWITGKAARRDAHRLRAGSDAILVGIGTVLADDPRLTVRLTGRRARSERRPQPLRVVLDSRLRFPLGARMVKARAGGPVVVMTTATASKSRGAALEQKGVQVVRVPGAVSRVSLRYAVRALASLGISRLLVEGGGEVNAAFLKAGLVDRVVLYVAPKLLGGRDAVGVIGGASRRLAKVLLLAPPNVTRLGNDLRLEARIHSPSKAKPKM